MFPPSNVNPTVGLTVNKQTDKLTAYRKLLSPAQHTGQKNQKEKTGIGYKVKIKKASWKKDLKKKGYRKVQQQKPRQPGKIYNNNNTGPTGFFFPFN